MIIISIKVFIHQYAVSYTENIAYIDGTADPQAKVADDIHIHDLTLPQLFS